MSDQIDTSTSESPPHTHTGQRTGIVVAAAKQPGHDDRRNIQEQEEDGKGAERIVSKAPPWRFRESVSHVIKDSGRPCSKIRKPRMLSANKSLKQTKYEHARERLARIAIVSG